MSTGTSGISPQGTNPKVPTDKAANLAFQPSQPARTACQKTRREHTTARAAAMISPYQRQARLATAVALCCIIGLWFWYFSHFRLLVRCDVSAPAPIPNLPPPPDIFQDLERPANLNASRIAKATVATNSLDSPLAKRALATHDLHNRRHGYRHFIATTEFVSDLTENDRKGRPRGAWSKPAFLMALIISELQKDEQERLRWI